MTSVTNERVIGWLIPSLLSTTLAVLGWIGININRISEDLAVMTYRLESNTKRIDFLEMYVKKSRKERDSESSN